MNTVARAQSHPSPPPRPHAPRVAIIHYWLVGMRGGEKVLEALLRMFPQADIFTHAYDPSAVSDLIRSRRVITTSVGRLPMATKLYQKYLPLMPRALEELDLTGYDLVLSSESGPAKGVIAPPDAPHICYCHSPMRYLWDQYHVYRGSAGLLTKAMLPRLAHRLRGWDVTSAARVDAFVANSAHVAARVEKYWRRDAEVVHPPVFVEDFAPVAPEERGDYYLWLGELAPYKRPDLAIEAFNRLGKPFHIIGGPDKAAKKLAAGAKGNVTFLGKLPFAEMKRELARAKALIFPGEEDFGIVPVEAMASGVPVIAYGRGGALDTVIDRETGLLFHEQSVAAMVEAVETFEAEGLNRLDPARLTAHAEGFNEAAFRAGMSAVLARYGFAPTAG
ncbi:MAG: glycosyl transferase [Rhodobacterales bacterium]|nr:MAG: glycosyl transferase [Rhodobacterales bacterium]